MDNLVNVNFPTVACEIVMLVGFLFGLCKAIVQKKPLSVIVFLCFLLWMIYMSSGIHLGGTPAPEAVTEYELYEMGHYYLASHGNYIEVSYDVYRYMQIMEIVGWVSFTISFVLTFVINKIETGSFFGKR